MMKHTFEEFIEKAKEVHGDFYDYSKVEFKGYYKKVCIVCPIHGEFWQTPYNHIENKQTCFLCSQIKKAHKVPTLTKEEFILKAKEIHDNKYDYSKVEYVNNKTKVCIICPTHGEFWIRPDMHLNGQGCKKCSNEKNGLKRRKTKEQFIEDAKQIHGNKYNYSKVEYINNRAKICVICPIHGEFWITPNNHLKGNGCKKCDISLLENDLINFFKDKNIPYIFRERKLPWLDGLEIDFYLPQYNIGIECQGIQHFKKSHFFEPLEVVQERDKRKLKLCGENGIKLLYYSNLGIKYPYFVYENKEELLKEIKNER